MLKQKNAPSVYFDDGAVTGISFYMLSFGRDPIALDVDAGDHIYFGRYKPFKAFYVEMAVANTVTTLITLEYYNGTTWVSVAGFVDDTNAFKRSGFMQFDMPADWEVETIGGEEKYFIRMSVALDMSGTTSFQGMNIVFSDDHDLVGVFPSVLQYLDPSEDTFILRHENSRDLIIQDIRNQGFTKTRLLADRYDQIDEWDLLHINEARMWSVYLTLSNIFSSLQSNNGDLYKEKSIEYFDKSQSYKAAFYLSLDKDDDGLEDACESAGNIAVRRLVRR